MLGRIFGEGYAVGKGGTGYDSACVVSEEGVGFMFNSILGWHCCGGRWQSRGAGGEEGEGFI